MVGSIYGHSLIIFRRELKKAETRERQWNGFPFFLLLAFIPTYFVFSRSYYCGYTWRCTSEYTQVCVYTCVIATVEEEDCAVYGKTCVCMQPKGEKRE